MKLVGKRTVDFERDGQRISGYRLYWEYPDDHVDGVATDTCFVSDSKGIDVYALSIGYDYTILYNKYGKVEDIVAR